jgi:hypothetical protein
VIHDPQVRHNLGDNDYHPIMIRVK